MNIDVSKWFRVAREATNLTQDQLGEKLAMSKGNVSGIENGRTMPSFVSMLKLSLLSGMPLPGNQLKSPEPETTVIIDQLTVTAECGSGAYSDYFELKGGLSFSRDWLKRMSIDPVHCYVIYAKGMSMYPTIQDGQAVLIDTNQNEPIENKVYLIARESIGLVFKRLSRDQKGNWVYVSDNQDKTMFADMHALGGDKIIGRAVWTGGVAGL